MNEDVAYWEVLSCTDVTEKKIYVNFYIKLDVNGEIKKYMWILYKTRCKWGNKNICEFYIKLDVNGEIKIYVNFI
jgi:hypothetical protein